MTEEKENVNLMTDQHENFDSFKQGYLYGFTTAKTTTLTLEEVTEWRFSEKKSFPPGTRMSLTWPDLEKTKKTLF